MSGTYEVITGDATHPRNEGSKPIIVPHIVNDIGKWGSGFVVAVTKRWGDVPKQRYEQWYAGDRDKLLFSDDVSFGKMPGAFELGNVQFIHMPNQILIANMIAQRGIKQAESDKPIRYAALIECMKRVKNVATMSGSEIHAPKFGTERAGGNWNFIEELIQEIWLNADLNVVIYEFS